MAAKNIDLFGTVKSGWNYYTRTGLLPGVLEIDSGPKNRRIILSYCIVSKIQLKIGDRRDVTKHFDARGARKP